MTRFTHWVLRHKLVVVIAWMVVVIGAYASIQPAVNALSTEFSLPGRESSKTADLIYNEYGNGGPRVNGPIVPVVTLPEG